MRPNAFDADVEHFLPGGSKKWLVADGQLRIDDAEDVLVLQRRRVAMVFEVSFFGDAEVFHGHVEFLNGEQFRKFRPGPAIELALVPFAVGILRRIKSAAGMGHVAENVAKDVADHVGVPFLSADEIGVEVEVHQLRVVIEHLFEVRDEPLRIDGVAGEPAAQLIIHAAGGHAVAGVENHLDRFLILESNTLAQDEGRQAGAGEFGCVAEAPEARLVFLLELGEGVGDDARRKRRACRGGLDAKAFELFLELGGVAEEFGVLGFPELGDVLEQLKKAGSAILGFGWKIGAAVKWFAIRSEKTIERPATLSGHGLDGGHINLVHVRAFFTVHFDADEMPVEEFGEIFVFK